MQQLGQDRLVSRGKVGWMGVGSANLIGMLHYIATWLLSAILIPNSAPSGRVAQSAVRGLIPQDEPAHTLDYFLSN